MERRQTVFMAVQQPTYWLGSDHCLYWFSKGSSVQNRCPLEGMMGMSASPSPHWTSLASVSLSSLTDVMKLVVILDYRFHKGSMRIRTH
ncbi:hypothetical protein E2C01_034586 [Portunus trituberculatus]|uniref:Uncharacterized protein n=1 Tax=Portunus trituberculatus TaxID=210409 RepID=A0A5B7F6P5_PORTR|nr:hypothetical protein [Portunus trituberculatus]